MQTDPRLRTQHNDDHSLVMLGGEFDVASRDLLRLELHQALDACRGDRLLIDLSTVEFMDCTVLGVLVRAHQQAGRLGVQLVLVDPPRQVRRLLEISQIDRLIPSRPGLQAALREPVAQHPPDMDSQSA
jgi:anti-anti-sigma factor